MANLLRIKEIAKEKNISLESLAKEAGITPQALHKLIRENSTRIDTLETIANILNVSVTRFFDETHSINVGHSINGDNDSINGDINFVENIKGLKKEIELKDQIIEEKERLIKFLLSDKDRQPVVNN
ncbi:MAG: helix-turn-helix domain-containing protein [Parabacteroides sp.]